MKPKIITVLLLAVCGLVNAQVNDSLKLAKPAGASENTEKSEKKKLPFLQRPKRNITKSNILVGPFFKTYHAIQEVKLNNRMSIQTDVKARLATESAPLTRLFRVKGSDISPWAGAKLSGAGNVTSLRIYTKDDKVFRGVYFGPYTTVMFHKFATTPTPAEFTDDATGAKYHGDVSQYIKLTNVGGGLHVGVQGMIKNLIAVDWTIIGIGFCSSTLSGGIEATNTSANFDFRNYGTDVNDRTFFISHYLPLRKSVEAEKVALKAHAGMIHIMMGISIGMAY